MTTEERDARLTAYALNDPGLSPTARHEIEAMLANDPASRQAVEETRRIGQLLTESLAAEQAAMPAESVVTIPAQKPAERKTAGWAKYFVAASVALMAGAGALVAWQQWRGERERAAQAPLVVFDDSASTSERGDNFRDREALTGPPRSTASTAPKKRTASDPNDDMADLSRDMLKFDEGRPKYERGYADEKQLDKAPKDLPNAPLPGPGSTSESKGTGKPNGEQAPASPVNLDKVGKGESRSDPKPDASERILGRPAQPVDPSFQRQSGGKSAEGDGKPSGTPALEGVEEAARPDTNDRHLQLQENSFTRVEGINALSTFGVDVDTASYAIVRKYLSMGQLPPPNAVRLEEMVNYFPYADKAPDGDDPFAVTVEMAECPWEPAHRLVRLGLKAKPIDVDKRPPSNIVFLIDVSGSMDAPNRLPLVKASLKLLVNQLGEKDRIAMVVYAGASGLVLDSTSATKKETILNALDSLQAGGSTNGAGGIQQAYDVARANFIKEGTNRVILCTDGDWNVGTTSTDALVKLIEEKRETGVFLSVFGFGMGNLRDEMMVQLAGKGNGNYGYIDSLREANKALVEQLGGTLVTVAKDVKVQVEFNPAVIKSYRLLGYEKRALAAKDFHDDKKDAGEMGAGHVVTALYELVPVGAADPVVGKVDGLRYQPEPAAKTGVKGEKVNEAFVVKMRHKKPDGDKSTLRELPVSNVTKEYEKASEDFQFSAAVASFAMLLRDSPYKGSSNYALVLELADAAKKHDPGAYRAEFIEMVRKAKSLAGK